MSVLGIEQQEAPPLHFAPCLSTIISSRKRCCGRCVQFSAYCFHDIAKKYVFGYLNLINMIRHIYTDYCNIWALQFASQHFRHITTVFTKLQMYITPKEWLLDKCFCLLSKALVQTLHDCGYITIWYLAALDNRPVHHRANTNTDIHTNYKQIRANVFELQEEFHMTEGEHETPPRGKMRIRPTTQVL